MYKTALKLFETIKGIDWGQHVELFRRRGSRLRFPSIIPFCYGRDIQKQLSRGACWDGGNEGWDDGLAGALTGHPDSPCTSASARESSVFGGAVRALQGTLRIRILEVYLALVGFAHKGSEEGQSTTDSQSTDPSGDPRGYPSLWRPHCWVRGDNAP